MTSPPDALLDPLTRRETDILQLICEGYSNQAIADRLFLTLSTVKWYNGQIFSKLGVHTRAEAIALSQKLRLFDGSGASKASNSRPSTLPAPTTTFWGRAGEVEAISALLRSPARVVTLVGPPGVGKTRLSLEAGAVLSNQFPDGVVPVLLTSNTAANEVAWRIAEALRLSIPANLTAAQLLANHLHDKAMLLILDNFEGVLDATPLLEGLIAGARGLKLLVTSREVLRLYGEHVFPVAPLPLPPAHAQNDLAAVAANPAVRLLVDRARLSRRDFQLTEANAPALARLCQRLDGLPLALELAAVQLKLMSPEQLLAQLSSRLGVLTEGAHARQHPLRAAIDWSYAQLAPSEKVAFAALSVFIGGWTLEAATAVMRAVLPSGLDTIALLSSLLNKSLLQVSDTTLGEPRFTLLETLREYADEKRRQAAWSQQAQRAHATYFLTWAEQIAAEYDATDDDRLLDKLEIDHDNLKLALHFFAAEADGALHEMRLINALRGFWFNRAKHREGHALTLRALQRDHDGLPALVRAGTYVVAGMLSTNPQQILEMFEKQLELTLNSGSEIDIAKAMMLAACGASDVGDYDRAIPLFEQTLAAMERLNDLCALACVCNNFGLTLVEVGQRSRGRALLEQGLWLSRQIDRQSIRPLLLGNLVMVCMNEGDYATAITYSTEALRLARDNGYRQREALRLHALAVCMLAQDDNTRACAYANEARAIAQELSLNQVEADALQVLSMAAEQRGDWATAERLALDALRLAGDGPATRAAAIERVALVAAATGDDRRAAWLLGCTRSARGLLDNTQSAYEIGLYQRAVAALEQRLGEATFRELWEAGARVTLDQAAQMASAGTPFDI